MRAVSNLLFLLAIMLAGCAILLYGYMASLACGYAPSAASCRAAPWELGRDDHFWLVALPSGIVGVVTALAILARRRSSRTGTPQDDR